MKELEAHKFVKAKAGGFVITELGLKYLKENKYRLYGPKKKVKKPKQRFNSTVDDDDEEEEEYRYGFGR
jgi:hypothetical protein